MPGDPNTKAATPIEAALLARRRPLGRGLEDISHLFLPPRVSPEPPCPSPSPSAAPAPLLLRPGRPVGTDQLAAAVQKYPDTLEAGLRVLDANVPCGLWAAIDLLAIDRADQLTVIDFDETLDEVLLIRGLGHCGWLADHLAVVRRLYPDSVINASLPPRLVLLAFQASPATTAIGRITAPHIDCYRCRAIDFAGHLGILCEPAHGR